MKLINTKTIEGKGIVNEYELNGYNITIATEFGTGKKHLSICTCNFDLPEIYYFQYEEEQFKIQTVSFGALNLRDMNLYLERYNNAMEVVSILKSMGF